MQKCDIIHFEFTGIAISHLDVLELYKPAKTYVSCRGSAEYVTPLIDPARRIKLEELFAKVDKIHCVSDAMKLEIKKYKASPEKIFINRPAVDLAEFNGIRTDLNRNEKFRILSVGRLTFQKGYIFALLAIRKLLRSGYHLEYHIIGAGEDYKEISYFLEFNNLKDNIKLMGAKSHYEVRQYMQNYDALLIASVFEGIANVSLEAMATGLPVVSTNAGGMGEVILDGFNGILVDCYDADAIANGIMRLMKDDQLGKNMVRNAKKTIAKEFCMDRQTAVYLNEYF